MGKACSFMFDDVIQLRLYCRLIHTCDEVNKTSHFFTSFAPASLITNLELCGLNFSLLYWLYAMLIINNEGILTSLPRCCCQADTVSHSRPDPPKM